MEPPVTRIDVSGDGAPGTVPPDYAPPTDVKDRYGLHLSLFLITFVSTAFSGAQFAGRFLLYEQAEALFMLGEFPVTWPFILDGLRFAFTLLLFLTVHEFGHYFAARYHRISTSLPYYIPAPIIGIGTLGAVIRIREPIPTLRKLFDIGAAGPLAGFVVALGFLIYAFATLPGPEYIMMQDGHEALKAFIQEYGDFPSAMLPGPPELEGQSLVVGNTLLYWGLAQFFPNVPPMYEMYHYPVLFGAWLGLFFTALNLLPVGQLDGGHIIYALVGKKWHQRIARGFTLLLLTSGAIGLIHDGPAMLSGLFGVESALLIDNLMWFVLAVVLYPFLHRMFDGDQRLIAPVLLGVVLIAVLSKVLGGPLASLGYWGWLIWCTLLVFLIRVDHPPVLYTEPLTPGRRWLGILSILIFILCFSIKPLYVV